MEDDYHFTEASVAQAWLDRYQSTRTELGRDTPPPSSPATDNYNNISGWGTNDDWGGPPTPPEIMVAIAAAAEAATLG